MVSFSVQHDIYCSYVIRGWCISGNGHSIAQGQTSVYVWVGAIFDSSVTCVVSDHGWWLRRPCSDQHQRHLQGRKLQGPGAAAGAMAPLTHATSSPVRPLTARCLCLHMEYPEAIYSALYNTHTFVKGIPRARIPVS